MTTVSRKEPCPVCKRSAHESVAEAHAVHYYDCDRCGPYRMTWAAVQHVPRVVRTPEQQAVLSYAIRRMSRVHDEDAVPLNAPLITRDLMMAILNNTTLPDPPEQVNNLILWIGEHTESGEGIQIDIYRDGAVIGSATDAGASFVLGYVQSEKLVTVDAQKYVLSIKGWERHREIKRGALDSRKAFMAMQYGDAELDSVLRNCFVPAVEATGFTLKLLYEEPKAGSIDDRMRAELLTSRFVIADLTHENRGAYWEAGFAEGAGKPVIYTCKKGHIPNIHFDTNHHLTVEWDPDDLPNAGRKLKNTIRATLPAEAKLDDDEA